ncbi:MAG: dihydrolipoyl dehydrogenase, partial [Clostridiales bacterium]|nr:dihydrolipoyl dehydrogenase [Clostridiales bacterium]
MYTYDLCILGGGPGGYEAAIEAAKLGKKVVVVEKDDLGGTCLLRGCIPTKAYHHHASLLHQMEKENEKGIFNTKIDFSYKEIVKDKDRIVSELVGGIHSLFKKYNIKMYNGYGVIKSEHELEVENEVISFEHLMIATGSHPIVPNIEGNELERVITSDELLKLEELPKSLIIVGAGVIGLEFAGIMNQFGVKVTIIEAMKNLLPRMDQTIVKRLKPLLKKQGIQIDFGSMVEKIEMENESNELKVTYTNKKGIEENSYAEYVLIAIGRGANLDGYGLDECGIEYTRKGIVTDENFKTNINNIYAIGDVNGKHQLAHASTAQGKQVVHHLFGDKEFNLSLVPSPIFTLPEMGSVGKTEETLKEESIEYKVFTQHYRANGKAKTLLEEDGILKILVDAKTDKILGVHILGERSSDMVHVGLLAIASQMTISELQMQIFAHPT